MLKIIVPIKRVVDPYVKVRIKDDHSAVDFNHCKMSINPFDEIALEEAIRLKEQKLCTEVVVVTVADSSAKESLRHALAMGADQAFLIETTTHHCNLNLVKILKNFIFDANILNFIPNLILMGKQTIDGDNSQTPPMLAGLLNWPQATFASKIKVDLNSNSANIIIVREIDQGLETLMLTLPAIISVDLRLNEPRFISLPNIMLAKRKPLQIIPLEDLHLNLSNHRKVLSVNYPKIRAAGIKLNSIDELIEKLQTEINF